MAVVVAVVVVVAVAVAVAVGMALAVAVSVAVTVVVVVALEVARAVAVASADAVHPAGVSWEVSLVPRGRWFPPPSSAAGIGRGGDRPPCITDPDMFNLKNISDT
jgi:hypothetical protein